MILEISPKTASLRRPFRVSTGTHLALLKGPRVRIINVNNNIITCNIRKCPYVFLPIDHTIYIYCCDYRYAVV